MTHDRTRTISKYLSFLLRHKPQEAGLSPDIAGWVTLDALMAGVRSTGRRLDRDLLEQIVAENNKNRFEIDSDRIRARQGHSFHVELDYEAIEPPEFLWHGTATKHLEAIKTGGLQKMSRHAVHLSPDETTASQVGRRHGKLVLLQVRAREHHETGATYYLTGNGV